VAACLVVKLVTEMRQSFRQVRTGDYRKFYQRLDLNDLFHNRWRNGVAVFFQAFQVAADGIFNIS